MTMNKKAGALASVSLLLIIAGLIALIFGFIYSPLATLIGVGIAVGAVIFGVFCLASWAGLYSTFGGDLDTLGQKVND